MAPRGRRRDNRVVSGTAGTPARVGHCNVHTAEVLERFHAAVGAHEQAARVILRGREHGDDVGTLSARQHHVIGIGDRELAAAEQQLRRDRRSAPPGLISTAKPRSA